MRGSFSLSRVLRGQTPERVARSYRPESLGRGGGTGRDDTTAEGERGHAKCWNCDLIKRSFVLCNPRFSVHLKEDEKLGRFPFSELKSDHNCGPTLEACPEPQIY